MQLPHIAAQPSIQVLMDGGTIFLHPAPSPELPTNDPILRGVIVLNLPRPKRIRSLSVRLVRFVNVCFPDFAYEYGRSVRGEVSISGDKFIDFKKGQHSFAFTLVVPSSSAPYERSQYGRVYYKIVATAKGDGLIGTDLVAERDVHIVVNPSDDGETQDLDLRVEGFHEDIGPWGTIITSQHLTVGGFLHFDFFLPSPPQNIKLLSATAYIHTTFVIKSIEHPKQPEQMVKHKRRLFLVDAMQRPEYQTDYGEGFVGASPDSAPTSAANARVTGGVVQETAPSSTQILRERPPHSHPSSPPSQPSSSRVPPTSILPTASSSSPSAGTFSRRFSIPVSTRRATSALLKARSHTVSSPSYVSSSCNPLLPSSSSPPSQHNNTCNGRPLMKLIPQGKAYQLSHLAGLPGDDIIRPSTVPGTNTPIRIAHEVVLEVRFERPVAGDNPADGDNRVRVLRVEKPIVISSCCCMLESVLVPSYTAEPDPPPSPRASGSSSAPVHRSLASGTSTGSLGGIGGGGPSDVCACGRRDVSETDQRAQLTARLMLQQSRGGNTEEGFEGYGGRNEGGASEGNRERGRAGEGGAYKALYRPVAPGGPQ